MLLYLIIVVVFFVLICIVFVFVGKDGKVNYLKFEVEFKEIVFFIVKRFYFNFRYFLIYLLENGRRFFILLYLLLFFDILDID